MRVAKGAQTRCAGGSLGSYLFLWFAVGGVRRSAIRNETALAIVIIPHINYY